MELIGSMFKTDIRAETGIAWEEWIARLEEEGAASLSRDRLEQHLRQVPEAGDKWAPIIAGMYEQMRGIKQVGWTADAGFQIGVRKTAAVAKPTVWRTLLSPAGLKLWLGDLEALPLAPKQAYESKDGVVGEIRSVVPQQKLRLTWQPRHWDNPSTLQIYLLAAANGRTTISFHQERLDDLYVREMMRRRWDLAADRLIEMMAKN